MHDDGSCPSALLARSSGLRPIWAVVTPFTESRRVFNLGWIKLREPGRSEGRPFGADRPLADALDHCWNRADGLHLSGALLLSLLWCRNQQKSPREGHLSQVPRVISTR